MKRSNLEALKKAGTIILSLLFVFVFLTTSSALAKNGTEVGDAGLGAAGGIGPLGIAAIATGTLAAVVIVSESVTDSSSTSNHTTSHHGD